MATAKQLGFRASAEDLALLDKARTLTGLPTYSDVLRFTLRQYAVGQGLVDLGPKPKPATKKR
jgi:hypothetical protein